MEQGLGEAGAGPSVAAVSPALLQGLQWRDGAVVLVVLVVLERVWELVG